MFQNTDGHVSGAALYTTRFRRGLASVLMTKLVLLMTCASVSQVPELYRFLSEELD